MELNEAARRIFLQHKWLIAAAVVIGAAVGIAVAVGSAGYKASTRLVLDSPDPQARAQSTALADTARAIATSPSLVQRALAAAGVSKSDPTAFAANDISVSALGSSGVLELSVTDASRSVAAAVSNALAREVIQTRQQIANGGIQRTRAGLAGQITALDQRIAHLDAAIAYLNQQLAGASGQQATALRTNLDRTSQSRDFLAQQRGMLESQQAGLVSSSTARPTAAIISAATAADAGSVGSPYRSDAVLGALLGLILGIAVAVVLEAVRPTLTGGDAVARELGTLHLGTYAVDNSGEPESLEGALGVTQGLKEAARDADVGTVDLLGAGLTVDFVPLVAVALDTAVAGANGSGRELTVRSFRPQDVTERKDTGLVVVVPPALKKSDLVGVAQLIRGTRWPLLGVMTYKTSQHWWTAAAPERHAAENDAEAMNQS